MASESFKLLTGILALKEFTPGELSDATGVNANTVKSWLKRKAASGRYAELTGQTQKLPSGGRPAQIWRVREDEEDLIRAELGEIGVSLDIGTVEEADAAFADDDIRILIRRHLLLAGREQDPDIREEELLEARSWLEHEEQRLDDWVRRGFTCPEQVLRNVAELRNWVHGLDLRTDRLWFSEAGSNVESMADWLTGALAGWFAGAGPADPGLFAPLELTYFGDLGPADALVRQLQVVVKTAELVETLPADRVIGALLMTLPRLGPGEAQHVVFRVLDAVGHDRIGKMLRKRMRSRHDTLRERRFTLHVLCAFEVYPQLLQNEHIGGWFDALPNSRLWSPTYVDSYLSGVEHRPDAHMMRVVANKGSELELLRDRLNDPDEHDWVRETQGLTLDKVSIRARLDRWLEEIPRWVKAQRGGSQDLAAGWSRFMAMS